MKMKTARNILIAWILVTSIVACDKEGFIDTGVTSTNSSSPNVLLIIADDLGKDAISGFYEGQIKASTPVLDSLRTVGLSFDNMWVNPTCTPTRASIITGKYGNKTGVRSVGDRLDFNHQTLQSLIREQAETTYSTALIGKWHLSGSDATVNPEDFGIDYYTGLIRGSADDYYRWQVSEDGRTSLSTEYITSYFTDRSVDWIRSQEQPWFLWLAYTAPHTPFHLPPSGSYTQQDLEPYTSAADPLPYYLAAIESLDFELGRLLASLSADQRDQTTIIFIGDNGTPNQVSQSPYSASTVKNSLYQGGINVPCFVSGAGVTRRGNDASLLTATDLFATIAEICGVKQATFSDSRSFLPLFTSVGQTRDYQYSLLGSGSEAEYAVSNGPYKLIAREGKVDELYHLTSDPYERSNLIGTSMDATDTEAYLVLDSALQVIR